MFDPARVLTETDIKEILHFSSDKGSQYFLDSLESDELDIDNIRVEEFDGERLLIFDKNIWEMFSEFVTSLKLTK